MVAEVTPMELETFFTIRERERIASFKREKRRKEWAASRMAVKLLAIENGLCETPSDCSVDSAYRRPSLTIGGAAGAREISITHSEEAGGAAIDEVRIGIDLQKTRPLADRATKFFLNPDEVGAWKSVHLPDSLIHFWCAKEAGYKVHAGHGWYRGVAIRLLESREDGLLFAYRDGRSEGTIETARLGDGFVCALARMTGVLPA